VGCVVRMLATADRGLFDEIGDRYFAEGALPVSTLRDRGHFSLPDYVYAIRGLD